MPDSSEKLIRTAEVKSQTEKLINEKYYYLTYDGKLIDGINPDIDKSFGDYDKLSTIHLIKALNDVINTYEVAQVPVTYNIPGLKTFSKFYSIGSLVYNVGNIGLLSDYLTSQDSVDNLVDVLQGTAMGREFLSLNGSALLKIALDKDYSVNLLGYYNINIGKIISDLLVPKVQDFYEARAYQYWRNIAMLDSSLGRDEDYKNFSKYMRSQFTLKFNVESLASRLAEKYGNKDELAYVITNALGKVELFDTKNEKTKVITDAIEIYLRNNKGITSFEGGYYENLIEVLITVIENPTETVIPVKLEQKKVEDIILAEKNDGLKPYSDPVNIPLIKKIISLLPYILNEYSDSSNKQITELVKDIIGNGSKFGNYPTFGSIGTNKWKNCNPVENSASLYNLSETNGAVLNKFDKLLPPVLAILKDESNIPIVNDLIKNIVTPRPDAMRFVYPYIMQLLGKESVRNILNKNPNVKGIVSDILIDIIQSSLVTNVPSIENKQKSLFGHVFTLDSREILLLEALKPLLDKVLEIALSNHESAPSLRQSLENLLTKLNTIEQDHLQGGLSDESSERFNLLLATFNLPGSKFDLILESFNNHILHDSKNDLIHKLISYGDETNSETSTSTTISSLFPGSPDPIELFISDCKKYGLEFESLPKDTKANTIGTRESFIGALISRKEFLEQNARNIINDIKELLGNEYLQSSFDDQRYNPIRSLSDILDIVTSPNFSISNINDIKMNIDCLLHSDILPIGKLLQENRDFIAEQISNISGSSYLSSFLMHAVIMPSLCVIDLQLATILQGRTDSTWNKIVVATETFISGGAVVGLLGVTVKGVTTLCEKLYNFGKRMITRGNKKGNYSELKVTMTDSKGPVNSGSIQGSGNTKTRQPVPKKGGTREYPNDNRYNLKK